MESDGGAGRPSPDLVQRLADLSHDLKTPLTSLKMSIHLLQDEAGTTLSGPQRELLAAAAEEVEKLHALIVEHLDKPRR